MKFSVWKWQTIVRDSRDLTVYAKLILLMLRTYMDGDGKCYPSIDMLTKDCSLSKSTVCKHLKIAVECGFIVRGKNRFTGQAWARNEYSACYPKTSSVIRTNSEEKVVCITIKGGPYEKEGGPYENKKAVREPHTNYPENYPLKNYPENTPYASEELLLESREEVIKKISTKASPKVTDSEQAMLDEFWHHYPKKKGKGAVMKKLLNVLRYGKVEFEYLMNSLDDYLETRDVKRGYVKNPLTWLNQECWDDENIPYEDPEDDIPLNAL